MIEILKNKVTKFSFLILGLVVFIFSCRDPNNKILNKDGNKAKLKLSKNEIFLNLRIGDSITDSIKIYNLGDSTLKIKSVNADCGCTDVIIKDSAVNPKDSMFIVFNYNSSHDTGRIFKTIMIESNSKPIFTPFFIKGIAKIN